MLRLHTLIWAADLKALYSIVNPDGFDDGQVRRAVQERRSDLLEKQMETLCPHGVSGVGSGSGLFRG